jgi:hypothetical protein
MVKFTLPPLKLNSYLEQNNFRCPLRIVDQSKASFRAVAGICSVQQGKKVNKIIYLPLNFYLAQLENSRN